MKNSSFWVVLGVVLLVVGISGMVPLHAEISMNEGNWESVTEMTMEGMPFQIPPTKDNPMPHKGECDSRVG